MLFFLVSVLSFFSLQKTTESLNLKPNSKKSKLREILWKDQTAEFGIGGEQTLFTQV